MSLINEQLVRLDADLGATKADVIASLAGVVEAAGRADAAGLTRDDRIRIVRDGTIIHDGKLHSLRRFKDDVKSVKQGYECGIGIEGFQDIKEGDIIEGFKTIEVARES